MDDSPLVKINLGTPEEIAMLYDIGSDLAERIVKYREDHGYFCGPEDLARVEGIGLDLAITLAPHIDWRVRVEPEPPKERQWGRALLAMGMVLALLWTVPYYALPLLHALLSARRLGAPCWYIVWMGASILGVGVCALLLALVQIPIALTRDPSMAQRLQRIRPLFAGLSGLATLSGLLSIAFLYQFYIAGGWTDLLRDYPVLVLASIPVCVVSVLFLGSQLLILWQPKMMYSPWLARIFDIGLVLAGPTQALLAWAFRDEWPLWVLAILGLSGSIFVYLGLVTIRTGKSFFSEVIDLTLGSGALISRQAETSVWMAWINARLPDPEKQNALKQALDKAYPPSRARTIFGFIVSGAGGWLVLTILGAMIEWIVQRWLNHLFP